MLCRVMTSRIGIFANVISVVTHAFNHELVTVKTSAVARGPATVGEPIWDFLKTAKEGKHRNASLAAPTGPPTPIDPNAAPHKCRGVHRPMHSSLQSRRIKADSRSYSPPVCMLKSSERIRERRAEGRTSDARAATLRSEALPNSWVGREASHAYSRSPRVYQRLCDLKVVHRNDIACRNFRAKDAST